MSAETRLTTHFEECPPNLVRNACIVAHVDHGKTTLADFLVSANGIISARLAGKLRYMDSREDEQTRGITMKSSAVSLLYEPLLLNLIDSPGHVDFVSEVSSAVNLADIAILVVDVIEGVCSQTESLVRQALAQRLDIVLVVNKLDRLVVELRMSEAEAYRHLQRLIEYVNSCLSQAIQGQLLEEDWQTVEQVESQLHFDPAKGNVLFASALHGYAFAPDDFALLWAKRIAKSGGGTGPEEERQLRQQLAEHLFSRDHFFSAASRRVDAGAEQRGKKTLFEQFVLEPLWELHKCALVDKDLERLRQIAAKLALPPLKGRRSDEAFAELMRHWLPLSSAVVRACAKQKSAARAFASDARLRQLFPTGCQIGPSCSVPAVQSLRRCDPSDQLTLVFAAKALKVDERRISLCRVMSGTLRNGDALFVLRPAKSGESSTSNNNGCWLPVKVGALFLVLGRELVAVGAVPAGRLCALEAAAGEWLGGQTLCSARLALAETPRIDQQRQQFAEPLVRVTVRPANAGAAQMDELRAALRQLAVLDSAVRILEQEDGDLAMLTAGEVHLQKCLEDLNALGQTEIVVSEPIVPFLETLVPDVRTSNAKIVSDQLTECFLRQFRLRIRLRAVPLHAELVALMERNAKLIDAFREGLTNDAEQRAQVDAFRAELVKQALQLLPRMKGSWWAKRPAAELEHLCAHIWAFGPAKARANILFCARGVDTERREGGEGEHKAAAEEEGGGDISLWQANLRPTDQALVGGFHLAMAHGPLCEEPLQGVGIVLEGWTVAEEAPQPQAAALPGAENGEEEQETHLDAAEDRNEEDQESTVSSTNGSAAAAAIASTFAPTSDAQLYGQLISAVRQTCRAALNKHWGALRLLAAMYRCAVQTPAPALGKVQTVLAQKRAKVISEEVNELTGLFEVVAHLPVVESFSFCDDLRKRTSGTASAQLAFSHWQLIEEDPHWQPTTEAEVEEHGSAAATATDTNQARVYMDAVRKRKGLATEEVIVASAEKQRTRKRNK